LIETTIKCVCDRCKTEVKEGAGFFKIRTEDIDTKPVQKVATNFFPVGDGIQLFGYEDKHKAYHLCTQCRIEMNEWMNKIGG
jgi:hypothetical protein